MFMDDFMMLRCTLECWNQLRKLVHHLGTSTKKWGMNGVTWHDKKGNKCGELELLVL